MQAEGGVAGRYRRPISRGAGGEGEGEGDAENVMIESGNGLRTHHDTQMTVAERGEEERNVTIKSGDGLQTLDEIQMTFTSEEMTNDSFEANLIMEDGDCVLERGEAGVSVTVEKVIAGARACVVASVCLCVLVSCTVCLPVCVSV